MASQSTLLGAAGEHFIMSQLLRRGFIAALAPQGVPNADIVVTDVKGSRLCSIQVKTRRDIGSDRGWHMKAKHEKVIGGRLFYCFVDFGKSSGDEPTIYVIPAKTVADVLQASHRAWLAAPGRNGRAHKDNVLRRLRPDYRLGRGFCYQSGWMDGYRDAWHILELTNSDPTTDASEE
jgi:hypothetical protein